MPQLLSGQFIRFLVLMGVNIKVITLWILRFVKYYRSSRVPQKHSSLCNLFLQVFMAEIIHIVVLWFLTPYSLVYNTGIHNEATCSKNYKHCPIDWPSSYKSSYTFPDSARGNPLSAITTNGTERKNFRRKTP